MRRSGVFIVNFEHISHLALVFLLLTLNMLIAGWYEGPMEIYSRVVNRSKCFFHGQSLKYSKLTRRKIYVRRKKNQKKALHSAFFGFIYFVYYSVLVH